MFELADNKKIGAYLKCKIKSKYCSVRQFGKKYLKERNMPTDDENLRKMSNRLSQILNGKKGAQLEDLPFFSKLLDMSCEEILSAGKCFSVSSNHATNYNVALSRDREVWEAYIGRDDQLILNADEYGKTIIDYALEFGNYDLLKLLLEQKLIWFVGTDEEDLFHYNFGAGTSIERNPLMMRNMNVLDAGMKERYDLRIKMITLAIKKKDAKMLTELRAREIPPLYQVCCFSCTPTECEKYFDEEMISALTDASDAMLEYFSKDFEIVDRVGITNRFIFPFISELIGALIETGNRYVEWMLKDAIKHNQYALDRLGELLDLSVKYFKELYPESIGNENLKQDIIKGILQEIKYHDDGKLVSYRTFNAKDGMITNVVKINATSEDIQTNRLIQEVNEIYDRIQNIKIKI